MDKSLASLVTPRSSVDPAALARAARAGDANALGGLYDAYAALLYQTALRLSGDSDDAQDVVHDCLWDCRRPSVTTTSAERSTRGCDGLSFAWYSCGDAVPNDGMMSRSTPQHPKP